MSWAEALNWIKSLNAERLSGYSDWRLPNRRELFSLISHDRINPALPAGHPFENVFPGYYWTSTTVCRLPTQAWYVHLGGARMVKGMKSGSYLAWPVRSANGGTAAVYGTGQKLCYTAAGELADCLGTGQDADIRAGLPWPLPRFEEHGETVTDLLTGMIWTRCADIGSGPMTWDAAGRAVRASNSRKLCGFSDWRLPHIRELESLCDMQAHGPALPCGHPFSDVQSFYWSATASRYDPNYAWALYFVDGNVGVGYKPGADFHLWMVRGGTKASWRSPY